MVNAGLPIVVCREAEFSASPSSFQNVFLVPVIDSSRCGDFAAAGMALTEDLVCEVVMGLGCIPLAGYGTPGTSELAQTLIPYVPQYDAILMSNHGVVAYGDTLEHAYMKMETVEHFAQIALVTHLLGRQQPLSGVDIEKLLLARTKYFGGKMNASMPIAMARTPENPS